jgi:hypothetical protein
MGKQIRGDSAMGLGRGPISTRIPPVTVPRTRVRLPVNAARLLNYAPSVRVEVNIELPLNLMAVAEYVPDLVIGNLLLIPRNPMSLYSYAPSLVIRTTITLPTNSMTLASYAPTPEIYWQRFNNRFSARFSI